MKRLLVAVAAALLIGSGIYLFTKFFRAPYSERVFPKDTIAYLVLDSTDNMGDQISQTLLWKEMNKSPRKAIYKKQIDRAMASLESVTGVDFRPLFKQFTRDVAIGFFPSNDKGNGVAFVAYIEHESDVQEFLEQKLDPNLKRRIPDLKKVAVPYKGATYYTYRSTKFSSASSPSYSIEDHHLFVGYTEGSIQRLFDVRNKDSKPLRQNDLLKDLKQELGYKRGVLLFVDLQGVLKRIQMGVPQPREKFFSALVRIVGADALRSFGYRMVVRDDGFEESAFLSVPGPKKGGLKIYFEQKPQKLDALGSLPVEGKVATAGTLSDLAKMWDEINLQLRDVLTQEQFNKWQAALGALKGLLSFDIRRDLLEPIGDQFGFSYEEAENASSPKQMKYLIALQLRNPDRMLETLNRLTGFAGMQGMQKRQENYQGKNVQVLNVQIARLVASPAYYVDKSWLYFSTDYGFLKKSIDAQASAKGVDSLPDYRKVTAGFPPKLNGLTYTNVPTYLQMYSRILNRQAESSEGRWMREYGLQDELNALSKVLFGAASYTQIEKDAVYIYSYSSVPRSLLSLPSILSAAPEIVEKFSSRNEPGKPDE